MIPPLPDDFLKVPLAHRALHDVAKARPENSRAAVQAAIDAGYGIEIDLQLTRDGQAVVFHDYDLARLTGRSGPVRAHTAQDLGDVALLHGQGETIPTFADVLAQVAGQVPLLVELKDQDGAMGADVGPLESSATAALLGYTGPVAVMSFNPHSVREMARLALDIPRGLVTEAYDPADWPLSARVCANLREIPDFESVGAAFISHSATDLQRPRVARIKAQGAPVLCWTIRSPQEEAAARRIADNITFEGYLADIPS